MHGEPSVARQLGEALRERDETIAVAESCTGGLLGSTITGVPGASDYFVGGIISYTNRTKRRFLAVSRELLERYGAVSEQVATAMARHARDEAGADWGVSTTGYAGSTPDSATAPAGTVFVGVANAGRGPDSDPFTQVERHRFDGTRNEVRNRAVTRTLRTTLAHVRDGSR